MFRELCRAYKVPSWGVRASKRPIPTRQPLTHQLGWFNNRYEIFSCGCFPFDNIENDDFGPLLTRDTKPMHEHLEFDEVSADT